MTLSLCLGLVLVTSVWGASHPEIWGEQPDQADIGPGDMRCADGFPKGRCLSYCHSINQAPTCFEGDVCLCLSLVERDVLGQSQVMEDISQEARSWGDPWVVQLHDTALGAALFYLAVVGGFLYVRRRYVRIRTSKV